VAIISCDEQGRAAIASRLVDASAALFAQASYNILVAILCCDEQGRGSIMFGFVDTSAAFLDQTSYNSLAAQLSRNVQGRGSVVLCLIDIGTKLLDEATTESCPFWAAGNKGAKPFSSAPFTSAPSSLTGHFTTASMPRNAAPFSGCALCTRIPRLAHRLS
jgi:hypothetical protein